jgi:inosose dehydratase
MQVRLGCGQITWRGTGSEEAVLTDIAQAGYEGAPMSARGGRSAQDVKELYESHNLVPAPGYFSGSFWDESKRDEHLESARRVASISAELGLTEIYVADGGFKAPTRTGRTRWEVAAHPSAEDSLSDGDFARLAAGLDAVGRATLEFGVRSCFHNHVGTFVETEAEIERLLASVDPEVLFLGPDTGHLAWGGVDVVDFTRRHAERIKTMHLKDIVESVSQKGKAAGWDYSTFEKNAIWTEIGEGSIDFAEVLRILDGVGFEGWLIVETDVTQLPTPLESAVVSRKALRTLGV